jgi:hypothetical protein
MEGNKQYFGLCDTLSVLERFLKKQVIYLAVTPVRGPLLPNTGPSEPLQTKLFGELPIQVYKRSILPDNFINFYILSCIPMYPYTPLYIHILACVKERVHVRA